MHVVEAVNNDGFIDCKRHSRHTAWSKEHQRITTDDGPRLIDGHPTKTSSSPAVLCTSTSLPASTYIERRHRITHSSSCIYSSSTIWIHWAIMPNRKQLGDRFSNTRPSTQTARGMMTQLRFEYKFAECGAPIVLLSQRKGREIINTTAGRALSDTLKAIAHEPGHGWTI